MLRRVRRQHINAKKTDKRAWKGSFQANVERLEERALLTATPQPFPYLEDFEAAVSLADLAGWSANSVGSERVTVTSAGSSHSGSKHLNIANLAGGISSVYAQLALDLSAVSDPISVWLEFAAEGADMELEVSGDGAIWQSLASIDLVNHYGEYAFDLDAELGTRGIALDGDVYLRFVNSVVGTVSLDDVRIDAIDTVGPRIVSVMPTTPTGPVTAVDITFSEQIQPGTFDAAALEISDDGWGGAHGIGAPVDLGDGKSFRVTLDSTLSVAGNYDIYFDFDPPNFPQDLVGNILQPTPGTSLTRFAFYPDLEISQSTISTFPYSQDFNGPVNLMEGWAFNGAPAVRDANSGDSWLRFTRTNFAIGSTIFYAPPTHAVLKLDLSSVPLAHDVMLQFELYGTGLKLQASNDGVNFVTMGQLASQDFEDYPFVSFNLSDALPASIDRNIPIYLRWEFPPRGGIGTYYDYLDNVQVTFVPEAAAVRVESVTGDSCLPLSSIAITFENAIDPSSFDASDVRVLDPTGALVAIVGNPVDSGDQRTFTIQLASPQTIRGTYRVQVGPQVFDTYGRSLDQNLDDFQGTALDVFMATLTWEATPLAPSLTDFEGTSFASLSNWAFETTNAATILLTSDANPRGATHLRLGSNFQSGSSAAVLAVDLSSHSTATDLYLEYWTQSLVGSSRPQVSLSGDGITWTTISTPLQSPSGFYFYNSFDLDEALTAAGIAIDSDVFVRFVSDGLASDLTLDDVRVGSGAFNRPPNITGGYYTTLPSRIDEDTTRTITVQQLANLIPMSDPDGDSLSYRLESIFGTLKRNGITLSAGDFLNVGESLEWTPPANFNGDATAFSLRAWDGMHASGLPAFVEIEVRAINDAPVLDPMAVYDFPDTLASNSVTRRVSDLVYGSFSDVDNSQNSSYGVAIFETAGLAGTWSYSTDGTTFVDFPPVSASASLLLRSSTYIRFTPTGPDAGTASISYRVWNRSNRVNGAVVDLSAPSSVGGATDYSAEIATSSALFLLPPVANAGGPYTIEEGSSLSLDGSSSFDPYGGALTFAWDINGDGVFTDAIGVNPTLHWSALNALGILHGGIYSVSVRATNTAGFNSVSDSATLTILGDPPEVELLGPSTIVRGQQLELTISALDPSPAPGPFTYWLDWNADGTFDESVVSTSTTIAIQHTFIQSGLHTVRVVAQNPEAMLSDPVLVNISVVDWALLADPNDPSKLDLHWGGTEGIDAFGFLPGLVITQALNNQFFGAPLLTFLPTFNGSVYVYAQGSNDLILADVMTAPMVIDGGSGDDVLIGGRAGDFLFGGEGNDILFGGTREVDGSDHIEGGNGDDFIVGHYGADSLFGGAGSDLIVAGSLYFPGELPSAVYSIQAEWLSGNSLATRVERLTGTSPTPGNNGSYILTPNSTALDDDALDHVFDEEGENWLLYDFEEDVVSVNVADSIVSDLDPLA